MADGLSNTEFAEAIGCHFTGASRILGGRRLPGVEMLERIYDAYKGEPCNLTLEELHKARQGGAEEFGKLLHRRVVKPIRAAKRAAAKADAAT